MARNYILVLSETLSTGEAFELTSYASAMSRGLSQATANQINGSLNLRPRSVKVRPGHGGTSEAQLVGRKELMWAM